VFGYVDMIFLTGLTLTKSTPKHKQRGRQVDLNQCNLPLILSTLAKNIIIVSVNDVIDVQHLQVGGAGRQEENRSSLSENVLKTTKYR